MRPSDLNGQTFTEHLALSVNNDEESTIPAEHDPPAF